MLAYHVLANREWLVDDEGADEAAAQEDYTPEELKRAQKITGELLWVTRSRPDVLFVVTMMASALARRPCHVYRVGLKVSGVFGGFCECPAAAWRKKAHRTSSHNSSNNSSSRQAHHNT